MTAPLVYFVGLSWDNCSDTLACLKSLRELEYENYRTVLVDNGSTDGIVASVREQFPEAHIIENSRNLGYAEGNNVGIRFALNQEANYVFLLNSDTVIAHDALAAMVRVGEGDSRVGILCPTLVSFFDPTKQYAGGRIDWQYAEGVEVLITESEREPYDTDYAPGSALLIKADVIRRIGLLDPRYFAYFEDVDWSVRGKAAGYHVLVVPQARVYHKGTRDQTHDKSVHAFYYSRRNQVLFIRKHIHWKQSLSVLLNYRRLCLTEVQNLRAAGETAKADAVLDGMWAGVTAQYDARRVRAPRWFRQWVVAPPRVLRSLIYLIPTVRRNFPVRTTARRLWYSIRNTR